MLVPFGHVFTEDREIVPIGELTHDAIEAAEAEIEQEENEWPATA